MLSTLRLNCYFVVLTELTFQVTNVTDCTEHYFIAVNSFFNFQ